MKFIKFGWLKGNFGGGPSANKPWILITGYWNDSGVWIDSKYWIDGEVPNTLYWGLELITFNGYTLKWL